MQIGLVAMGNVIAKNGSSLQMLASDERSMNERKAPVAPMYLVRRILPGTDLPHSISIKMAFEQVCESNSPSLSAHPSPDNHRD